MIGIELEPLTPALAKQLGLDPKTKGVLVGEVFPGSPGDKAGLQQGDVITGFDGTPAKSVASFRNLVSTSEIGKEFALTYLREGQEKAAKVTLVPYEDRVLLGRPTAVASGRGAEARGRQGRARATSASRSRS